MGPNSYIGVRERDHLLQDLLQGLRVQAAGLKLFNVSINDLLCHSCIGGSLCLNNNGAKLRVLTDITLSSRGLEEPAHASRGLEELFSSCAVVLCQFLVLARNAGTRSTLFSGGLV